jgi:HIV Tat-specific factor 1
MLGQIDVLSDRVVVAVSEQEVFDPDVRASAVQCSIILTSSTLCCDCVRVFVRAQAIAANAVLQAAAAKTKRDKVAKRKLKANSAVYMRGLPPDATEAEVLAWAKKAGVVRVDPDTELPKVKLFRNADGTLKGDAAVTYLFPESVQQAVLLLDGDQIRAGFPVAVEPAQFGLSRGKVAAVDKHDGAGGGDDDDDKDDKDDDDGVGGASTASSANKATKKVAAKSAKPRLTVYEQQQRALDWDEDMYKKRHVILKHLFSPSEVDPTDLAFYTDLRADVRDECEKLGPVESVHVFEGSPDGVVAIKFRDWLGADRCIKAMDGRWFAGRQVAAEYFDPRKEIKQVAESDEARAVRDASFAEWLETGGVEAPTTTATTTATTQQQQQQPDDDDE